MDKNITKMHTTCTIGSKSLYPHFMLLFVLHTIITDWYIFFIRLINNGNSSILLFKRYESIKRRQIQVTNTTEGNEMTTILF